MQGNFEMTIGEKITFSPIRLGLLRQKDLFDNFKQASEMERGKVPGAQQITAMLQVLHAAAQKADETMTWERFISIIDEADPINGIREILLAYQTLMVKSGFSKQVDDVDGDSKPVGEEKGSQISTLPVSTD